MTADNKPLLPAPLRAMPFDWGQWPDEEDEGTVRLARAVLEAALPAEPLSVPEPPFLDDDCPGP
ncbi:hypothetical protein AB0C77_05365 [Streptomyces sp. NPDC048629]|uniref:hypothetical protein n=1 Tax=Streptomyces sp. NPDC048629 TaxID=3154824 RepID=UPI00342BB4AC